jgi:hypothetical protein
VRERQGAEEGERERTSSKPHLEVSHHVGVLQPAECRHLPQDARVAATATPRLQLDLLHSILAAVKPAAKGKRAAAKRT